jgi:hypothetical protein
VAKRREIVRKIENDLAVSPAEPIGEVGPYDALLKIAGSASSRFRDVSTNKKKHLAATYRPRRR